MWLQEVQLQSSTVKLMPLLRSHADALLSAASDGELWKLWFTSVPDKQGIDKYIEQALSDKANGLALPFVVVDVATDCIVGSTRFCHADPKNQRVEIGYTWYAQRAQRTGINTQCKMLLLTHAFEKLDAIAVELRTHWHNHKSRAAIARLGAKQDGIIRHHLRMSDGSYRDTVLFSIIDSEWPAVKNNLTYQLNRFNEIT